MGFRLRKSIKLGGGARINLSRSGVGMSVGGKGGRIGVGPRGVRASANVPGTGISYQTRSRSGSRKATVATDSAQAESTGCFKAVGFLIALGISITYPPVGVVLLIGWFLYRRTPKQRARRLWKKAMHESDPRVAYELATEARELDPESIPILRGVGYAAINAEDFGGAAQYLSSLAQREPLSHKERLMLGYAFQQSDQFDDAISALQQIPEDFEDYTKAVLVLGAAFSGKGDVEAAIDVFKKGPLRKRNLDDDLRELHYQLGMHYAEIGDKSAARRHYRRVYTDDLSYRDVQDRLEQLE